MQRVEDPRQEKNPSGFFDQTNRGDI